MQPEALSKLKHQTVDRPFSGQVTHMATQKLNCHFILMQQAPPGSAGMLRKVRKWRLHPLHFIAWLGRCSGQSASARGEFLVVPVRSEKSLDGGRKKDCNAMGMRGVKIKAWIKWLAREGKLKVQMAEPMHFREWLFIPWHVMKGKHHRSLREVWHWSKNRHCRLEL